MRFCGAPRRLHPTTRRPIGEAARDGPSRPAPTRSSARAVVLDEALQGKTSSPAFVRVVDAALDRAQHSPRRLVVPPRRPRPGSRSSRRRARVPAPTTRFARARAETAAERVPRRVERGFAADRRRDSVLPTLGFAAWSSAPPTRQAHRDDHAACRGLGVAFAFTGRRSPLVGRGRGRCFRGPAEPNSTSTSARDAPAPAFYYFTDLTRELDALVGRRVKYYSSEDLEAEVLRDLRARTLRGARGLRQLALCVGEIDVALALARARSRTASRGAARRALASALRIRGGGTSSSARAVRVEAAVPNDADMGEPGGLPDGEAPTDDDDDDASPTERWPYGARRPRVVVITGPTQSGKSCYAYAMATIAFLAHAARFVRPRGVRGGGFGRPRLRARFGEDQLATRDHRSTFTRDVDRVSRAIRAATARTILVVDEFGKGPGGADGAGLLCGFVGALADAAEVARVRVCHHALRRGRGRDPRAPPPEPGDRAHARGGGRARDGGVRGARRGDY